MIRIVTMTHAQAVHLRAIIRLVWQRELYLAITTIPDPAAASIKLMSLNDSWVTLHMPVEMFIDATKGKSGQLLVNQTLFDNLSKVLAVDLTEQNLPQITKSAYTETVAPLLQSVLALRRMIREADLVNDDDLAVTQLPSIYKN